MHKSLIEHVDKANELIDRTAAILDLIGNTTTQKSIKVAADMLYNMSMELALEVETIVRVTESISRKDGNKDE